MEPINKQSPPLVHIAWPLPGYGIEAADSTVAWPLARQLLSTANLAGLTTIAAHGRVDIYVRAVTGAEAKAFVKSIREAITATGPQLPVDADVSKLTLAENQEKIPNVPVQQISWITLHLDLKKLSAMGIRVTEFDQALAGKYREPTPAEPATQEAVEKLLATTLKIGNRQIVLRDIATAALEKGPDHIQRTYGEPNPLSGGR